MSSNIRAFRHVGLGVKEYAIRAEIFEFGRSGAGDPAGAPDAQPVAA